VKEFIVANREFLSGFFYGIAFASFVQALKAGISLWRESRKCL